MASLDELKQRFLQKLEKFPFRSDEEAKALGVVNYKLAEDAVVALETPFSMKARVEYKAAEVEGSVSETASVESTESSAGESTDSNPCHEDEIELEIDLSIKGRQIIKDCSLTITKGRSYGLVGRNGIGKTTLLNAIRKRRFGIPRSLKIHIVEQDCRSTETVEEFVGMGGRRILDGLGFTGEMLRKSLQSLSGGWRMRAQLAKAFCISPDLLLLDEPTNYLDINALTWLESEIPRLRTVIIVSHDRSFLNNTVDYILHLSDLRIDVYRGNYDGFAKQRAAKMDAYRREYENQMATREHLQSFIDRFRYNAKRAAQAQSKIKALARMPVLEPPKQDPIIKFSFSSTPAFGALIEFSDVAFSYGNDREMVFRSLNIKISRDSRIVVVGANGQGKSTFLKLLTGNLRPTEGHILRHGSLRVGYFAQHHIDHLRMKEKVLSFMMKERTQEESRRALAAFGLSIGNQRIGTLSGGQKSRLSFAIINTQEPNLLVLDEPTNHLDIESIDALADAIRRFDGAVICVSHDLSFVSGVFSEVYVCEDGELLRFNGDIFDYRDSLKRKSG
jgi:ATP-binding cassette, subfamily F, member 3